MKVTITKDMLAAAKTDAGGYTRAQMHVFGLPWPPPKGWLKSLIGIQVEPEQFEEFMNARLIQAMPPQNNESDLL